MCETVWVQKWEDFGRMPVGLVQCTGFQFTGTPKNCLTTNQKYNKLTYRWYIYRNINKNRSHRIFCGITVSTLTNIAIAWICFSFLCYVISNVNGCIHYCVSPEIMNSIATSDNMCGCVRLNIKWLWHTMFHYIYSLNAYNLLNR